MNNQYHIISYGCKMFYDTGSGRFLWTKNPNFHRLKEQLKSKEENNAYSPSIKFPSTLPFPRIELLSKRFFRFLFFVGVKFQFVHQQQDFPLTSNHLFMSHKVFKIVFKLRHLSLF